jgi:hypothetical protein
VPGSRGPGPCPFSVGEPTRLTRGRQETVGRAVAVRGILAYLPANMRIAAQPGASARRERRLLLRFCAGTHERPSRPRDR